MRKRGARFKQRNAVCPTVVKLSFGEGVDFEVMTYTAISALMGGWAEDAHVTHLHDLANAIVLIGHHKQDENAKAAGRAARLIVRAAADRFKKHGKFGISGDELKMLRKFAAFALDYYRRTSGETVTRAELTVIDVKQKALQERKNVESK